MTDLPRARGGYERLDRLMASVALEPYRQSLVKAHAQLMSDMNGGAAERARLMIEENRRG